MASIQITPIASFVGSALATQDDGKVLQVGTVWAGGRSNIALVRYNTDGSRDTIFSGINTATISPGTNYVGTSVSLTDDGFILVGGYSSNDTTHIAGPALFRFNPDGSLDGSFYNGGPTDLGHNGYATSIAIQPDGKTLVAGSYSNIILVYGTGQSMPTQFGVDRHNPDGTLDTSFGVNGRAVTGVGMSYGQDQCNGITVQSDGKFILVGQSPTTDSLTQFTLIRYLANGTLDNSFSNDGIATTRFGSVWDGATSVTVDSHNNILVAGHSYQGNNYDFALARFAPDGTLDTNFSSDGRVTTNLGLSDGSNAFATSVAVDSSDNVLVAGVCYVGLGWDAQGALLPTAHYAFGIARYTSAGVLDTDFNENGHVIVDIPTGNGGGQGSTVSISIQGDGKILLSGTHVRADGTSDFAAIRLNANGSVDETFILGSNSADTLYGSDASDFIIGNAANDLLIGGYGSDELVGGSGDDTLNGGDGIDCADYSSAVNGVNVNLKTGNANGIGTSGLTETGVDSLVESS